MEVPAPKYFRLSPGREVRLMGAYFVTCTGVVKDESGKVVEVHCTYDPETKGGNCETRKVKGTIHWVAAGTAVKACVRLYDHLFVYNPETDDYQLNEDSLETVEEAYVEPSVGQAEPGTHFQFVRNGYFILDPKESEPGKLVINRTVALKSSFKPII